MFCFCLYNYKDLKEFIKNMRLRLVYRLVVKVIWNKGCRLNLVGERLKDRNF